MNLPDVLSAPIKDVVGSGNQYGGLFDAKPIALPKAPTQPLTAISKPIKETVPIIPKAESTPAVSRPASVFGALARPINEITPIPQKVERTVRNQDFKDVVNLIPNIVGGAVQQAGDIGSSALKLANDKLGTKFPTETHVSNVFQDEEHGGKYAYQSHTLQNSYAKHIAEGNSPTKAALKVALEGGMDIALAKPFAEHFVTGFGEGLKSVAKGTMPEKLITPELITASRNDVQDFLAGRTTSETSPLPKDLLDAIKEHPDKKQLLRGFDLTSAKPSRLGKLLGVSEEEANQILKGTYGGPIREASKGALPGYRPENPRFAGMSAGLSTERLEPVGFGKEIPKELKPLAEEAKKYKSAEEFVKAKGKPLYHGSAKADLIRKDGFKLPTSIAEQTDAPVYGDGVYFSSKRSGAYDTTYSGVNTIEGYIPKDMNLYPATEKDMFSLKTQVLKEKGYDGVEVSFPSGEKHVVVFDPAKIKTKEQLFSIYDSVHGTATDIIPKVLMPLNVLAKKSSSVGDFISNAKLDGNIAQTLSERYKGKDIESLLTDFYHKATGRAIEPTEPPFGPGSKVEEFRGKAEKELGRNIALTSDEKRIIGGSKANLQNEGRARLSQPKPQSLSELRTQRRPSAAILSDRTSSSTVKKDFGNVKGQEEDPRRAEFTPEITESNGGVIPPEGRGGLVPPEIDFKSLKDVNLAWNQRETLDRIFDKISPDKPTANKLKTFLYDAVKENETAKARAMSSLRDRVKEKLKSLKIKMSDKDLELIMHYGEGRMSYEELQKYTKRPEIIKQASDYFRDLYDRLIDQWNAELRAYNMKEVPKRPNYFRHFDDVNFFTKEFGFIDRKNLENLPTSIAGETEFYKPGKPFSSASLRRLGNQTSYNPIKGLDEYIDSIYRQIYHIDSVQRGRVLEKYIKEAAKAMEAKGEGPNLQNFSMLLQEYINAQLAGKLGTIDRGIEKTFGRPIVSRLRSLGRHVGKNIIAANISASMSHLVSLPLNFATVSKIPFTKAFLTTLTAPLKAEPFTHINGVESSFMVRRYPREFILPTKIDRAEQALNVFMSIADRLKVRMAVASKFYEGVEAGLEPEAAMDAADKYAAHIVGDPTVGSKPNIMNNRSATLFAQFQLGLNDGISVLTHDIPNEAGDKWRIISAYIQFAIASYVLNEFIYKKIRGAGKGIDLINLGLTLLGLSAEGEGKTFGGRVAAAGTELAGELPFTNIFTGNFPVREAFPHVYDLLTGKTTLTAEGERLASELLSPIGGGIQAKKTISGINALLKGHTTTASGKTRSDVDQNLSNYIKGILFGSSALNKSADVKVADLKSRLSSQKQASTALTLKAEAFDEEMQGMPPEEAAKKYDDLQATDPTLAKKVATVVKERDLGLNQEERLMKQLGVANGERARYIDEAIKKLPAEKRADYYDELTTKKVITPTVAEQIQKIVESGGSLPAVADNTTHSSNSIIDKVLTYAKAIGMDPATAFSRIFSGQTIKEVKNGTVIVERMSLAESSQDKKDLGGTGEMTLDHVIPLELGGSNSKDNLMLVPKAQAAEADKIENLLGKALQTGKIDKAKAQDLIKRFKKGVITAEEVKAALP